MLFVFVFPAWAGQKQGKQKVIQDIAEAISVPLYGYDLNSVGSVIKTMLKGDTSIHSVVLIDANSDAEILALSKGEDGEFVQKPSLKEDRSRLRQNSSPVINDNEEIGLVTVFYRLEIDKLVSLTDEEIEWLAKSPVAIVGNETDWPPFDFAKDGEPKGYSIDFIRLAAKKVGLELEFVNGFTWAVLLEKLLSGEVDVLPAIYETSERKKSLVFTEAYFLQPSVLIVESSNQEIGNLNDLKGKRLAAIKGFAITSVMEEKHPEIELVKFDSLLDALMAVSTGKADGFIESIGNVSYLTEENFIPNVKFISDPSLNEIQNPALHMGIQKEKKILRDILQKGIAAIEEEEKELLADRWVPLEVAQIIVKETDTKPFVWLAVGIACIFLVLLLATAALSKAGKSDKAGISLGTKKFRWITICSLGVFISIVVLISWLVLEQNRAQVLSATKNNLTSTLRTTWERMHLWIDGKQSFLKQISRDPELVMAVDQLVRKNASSGSFVKNFNSSGLATFFSNNREELKGLHYMVVDPNFTTIADDEDNHIGEKSILSALPPKTMEALLGGGNIFIPAGSLGETNRLYKIDTFDELNGMYFAEPIKDADANTIAILVQQVDPAKGFSKVLQFSRIGDSGESYAFDALGRLLSESRFDDHLRAIGLIDEGGFGILSIEVRDPGGNMVEGFDPPLQRENQPLTLMAKSALSLMSAKGITAAREIRPRDIHINMEGYRDYRGVPVTGAWLWDGDLGFGMTSEIDVSEALSPYYAMRNTLVGILGFTLSLLVGITLFVFLVGERTNRALQRAKEELEDKVKQRTAEIEAQRSMLELTIESLTHPFYVVNASDYTLELANSAARKSVDDGVVTCHALTHHSDTPCNSAENPCPMEEVKRTKKPVVVEHTHSDEEGNEFFAEVHGYPIFDEVGEVIKMIEYSLDITERKKAEEELNKLSLVVEQSPVSVVITNPEGVIEYLNPGFTAVTGYSLHEAVGKTPSVLKSGSHPDAMYQKLWKTIKGGETWNGVFHNKKKDGTLYWENATISPIKDGNGNTTHFVGIKEDITQRVEAEAKLKEAHNIIRQQKERMEQELNVAHEIQMSMLPLVFPAYPDREEFSVHAKLQPAREVGGDFYDFYFIDEDRLCFTIGDVSDKGVPSALFMAVTTTLIKSRAADDSSTASIMTHINDELSQDNLASMFVTIVTGILNVKTGELLYTNAGHNPPFIQRVDGELERLGERHGLVVGAMDGIAYQEKELKLEPGDMLVLYTDGVTEAENPEGVLFSEERLKKILTTSGWDNTEEVAEGLYQATKDYEGGQEQGDDITTMAIRYNGANEEQAVAKLRLTMKNELDGIGGVAEEFEAFAEERELPFGDVQRINIVFDEVLNNVVSYAFKDDAEHEISIEISHKGAKLMVTITDDGVPFNPLNIQTPDTSAEAEDREIGGLGIHMVKTMVDEISYHRKIDKNVLKFEKKLN